MNIVVIGAGLIGPSHCEAILRNSQATLYAVVDKDINRARNLVDRLHSSIKVTDDLTKLANDPHVDAFVVATPHNSHASIVSQLTPTGKHILIEKPVVINSDDIAIFAEKSASQIIAVAHQMRYRPLLKKIKQLLEQGRLGSILTMHLELACRRTEDYFKKSDWRGNWQTEGGSVAMNSGLHLFDTALWFMNDMPVSAYGMWSSHIKSMETDDRLAGLLQFENDVYATVNMTSESQELFRPRLTIITTEATLILEISFEQKLIEFTGDGSIKSQLEDSVNEDQAKRRGYDGHPADLSHLELMDAFVDACVSGNVDALTLPEDAFRSVATINALYESGRQKKVILIK